MAYMLHDDHASRDELYAAAATFTVLAWAWAHLYMACQVLAPGTPPLPHSPRAPIAAATLCGPFTRPTVSWNPGPMQAFMVLLMPDALAHMTGLDTAALLDRIVPAEEVFDADWQALFAQVAQADNDDQRVALVEAFLLPRWQQSRPASALHSHRLTDWSRSVALRAASSGLGRSLRQLVTELIQFLGRQTQQVARLSIVAQVTQAACPVIHDQPGKNLCTVLGLIILPIVGRSCHRGIVAKNIAQDVIGRNPCANYLRCSCWLAFFWALAGIEADFVQVKIAHLKSAQKFAKKLPFCHLGHLRNQQT